MNRSLYSRSFYSPPGKFGIFKRRKFRAENYSINSKLEFKKFFYRRNVREHFQEAFTRVGEVRGEKFSPKKVNRKRFPGKYVAGNFKAKPIARNRKTNWLPFEVLKVYFFPEFNPRLFIDSNRGNESDDD